MKLKDYYRSTVKRLNLPCPRVVIFSLFIFLLGSFCPWILGLHFDYSSIRENRSNTITEREHQSGQAEKIQIEKGKEKIVIFDQMTLLEVEEIIGIEARCIADELSLPPEVPVDLPLELIRRIYPFTLQELKEVLEKLIDQNDLLPEEKKEGSEAGTAEKLGARETIWPREMRYSAGRHRSTTGRMASIPSGILITGKTTLYDLEKMTGIPARKIADALGIPSEAPLNEHIGFLRKRYRFSIQTVREIVAALLREKNTG
jgi:hypothetical protein